MRMEDAALLGVLVIIALLGFYIMMRLDRFLDKLQAEADGQDQKASFRIATSCLNAIPAISNALQDFRRQYPDIPCTISVGQERDVIESFNRGEADVAIVDAKSDVEHETQAKWSCYTLNPQPFCMEAEKIELEILGHNPVIQKVLWQGYSGQSLAVNFMHHLCGQIP